MNHFQVEQETVRYYRELLKDNPLIFGRIQYDTLYRDYDNKGDSNNYIEVSFNYTSSKQNHKKGSNNTIDVLFTVYASNQILCNNATTKFHELVENHYDDLGNKLQNLRHYMNTARVNNNKYSKVLASQLFFTNC